MSQVEVAQPEPTKTREQLAAALEASHMRRDEWDENAAREMQSNKGKFKHLRRAQEMDEQTRVIIQYIEKGRIPDNIIERVHLQTADKYVLKDGVLWKVDAAINGSKVMQLKLCIPRRYQCELC